MGLDQLLCCNSLGFVLFLVSDSMGQHTDLRLLWNVMKQLVLLAIARRRKLLNDYVLIALADSSWEILDISGSDVSNSGLCHALNVCQHLRAVDIR